MFILMLGWLAQHRKGWVVLATGTALFASGIGIFVAGFTSNQPLISRVGVLIVLVAVIFAVLAVGARRSRTRKNPDGAAPGELGKRCIRFYAIRRWAKRPPSVRKSAGRTRLPGPLPLLVAPMTGSDGYGLGCHPVRGAEGTSIWPTSTATNTGRGEGSDRPVHGCFRLGWHPHYTEPQNLGFEVARGAAARER